MNVFVFVQGFAAFVDPDPVEQESPDVILACAGQKENLSESLLFQKIVKKMLFLEVS